MPDHRERPQRRAYPSDCTDAQWALIADLVTRPLKKRRKSKAGRKRCHPREIWDAVNYVLQTGCRWEDLPHDFGCSPSVAHETLRYLKRSGRLRKAFECLKAEAEKKTPQPPERLRGRERHQEPSGRQASGQVFG